MSKYVLTVDLPQDLSLGDLVTLLDKIREQAQGDIIAKYDHIPESIHVVWETTGDVPQGVDALERGLGEPTVAYTEFDIADHINELRCLYGTVKFEKPSLHVEAA